MEMKKFRILTTVAAVIFVNCVYPNSRVAMGSQKKEENNKIQKWNENIGESNGNENNGGGNVIPIVRILKCGKITIIIYKTYILGNNFKFSV
jgi:hypothetical protein